MRTHTKMKYTLQNIVKFHRKQAGLSRKDLALLAGVSTTFLTDLEGGKETLQFNKIVAVLKTLNISLAFNSPIMKDFENETR